MESILGAVEVIVSVVLLAFSARLGRVWYELNASRNQARRILRQIIAIHAEAIALPSSLPKTFPAETQFVQVRELPPELQRRIVGHFRALERVDEQVL